MAAPTQRTSVAPATLSSEINTATRSLHADLNKLITSRLPLALPPFAPDPSLYTTGLLHFAHIFLTFESLWADLPPPNATFDADADAPSPPTSPLLSYLLVNPYASPTLFTSTTSTTTPPSQALLSFLHTLRPTALPRSTRLKKDLQHLTKLHATDFDVLLAKYPSEEVASFCAHIRDSCAAKPHVLVAYAWCFYMAVFSGGRWIRGELLRAGPAFWSSGVDSHAEVDAGIDAGEEAEAEVEMIKRFLSLWYFPGALDGEDIKAAFKERLLGAEELFSAEQRGDVIEEAKTIFQRCAGVVHELDAVVGTDLERVRRVRVAERMAGGGGQVHAGADVREGVSGKSVTGTMVSGKGLSGKEAPAGWASAAWLRRPEVTGAAVAIGCLACAVALRLSY